MAVCTKREIETKIWEGVRCLSVPQEALLLLQLLDLLLILRLSNELIDVGEIPFGRDIKSSVLLANAITSSHVAMGSKCRAVKSHSLGHGSVIHGICYCPFLLG